MGQDGVKKSSTMIAIYPPEEFLSLADKHAHPELISSGLHVTLYYVGDTSPDDDEAMIQALQAAMMSFSVPVVMSCNGPGCFYDTENDRFIRKLTMNAVGLDLLRYKVLTEMWRAGYVGPQTHGFSAHLTLQYHDDTDLFPGWERCGLEPYPSFPVNSLYLVRQNKVIAQVFVGGKVVRGGENPAIKRLL
jgi:2'-5' RNA ligase